VGIAARNLTFCLDNQSTGPVVSRSAVSVGSRLHGVVTLTTATERATGIEAVFTVVFELEHSYLLGGSPRRAFRDAKVQRIENMASDIAVGIAVLAAAKKDDQVKREKQARQREEERRLRELALRRDHIAERRGKALDEVLEEVASLDRLRRLVANLRGEEMSGSAGRVTEFLLDRRTRAAVRETEAVWRRR